MTNGPQQSHALIVGVGPGLGVAVARRFGREGFALTLVARDPAKLAGVADGLRAAGLEVQTVAADVADTGAFRTALEHSRGASPRAWWSTTPPSLPGTAS